MSVHDIIIWSVGIGLAVVVFAVMCAFHVYPREEDQDSE